MRRSSSQPWPGGRHGRLAPRKRSPQPILSRITPWNRRAQEDTQRYTLTNTHLPIGAPNMLQTHIHRGTHEQSTPDTQRCAPVCCGDTHTHTVWTGRDSWNPQETARFPRGAYPANAGRGCWGRAVKGARISTHLVVEGRPGVRATVLDPSRRHGRGGGLGAQIRTAGLEAIEAACREGESG